MTSLRHLLSFLGIAASIWCASAACSLGDGACLRMSDCESPYTCVEGTCRSGVASDAPANTSASLDASPASSASSSPASSASASPASLDASILRDSASDAPSSSHDDDGGASDAASDR